MATHNRFASDPQMKSQKWVCPKTIPVWIGRSTGNRDAANPLCDVFSGSEGKPVKLTGGAFLSSMYALYHTVVTRVKTTFGTSTLFKKVKHLNSVNASFR